MTERGVVAVEDALTSHLGEVRLLVGLHGIDLCIADVQIRIMDCLMEVVSLGFDAIELAIALHTALQTFFQIAGEDQGSVGLEVHVELLPQAKIRVFGILDLVGEVRQRAAIYQHVNT